MLKYRKWTFSSCDSNVNHEVTDIRFYSDENEKINIELKPVCRYPSGNGTMSWEDWNYYDSICIYKTDWEIIIIRLKRHICCAEYWAVCFPFRLWHLWGLFSMPLYPPQ